MKEQKKVTRRSDYEVVINPEVNTHVRKRTAVNVVHAPTVHEAAERLLKEMENNG